MKTGDDFFDSAEFRSLLQTYEQSINTGESVFMDADDLVEIADYYQYTGRMDQANGAIELASQLSPNGINILTYRIHESLSKSDTVTAWDYLNRMIDTHEPDYVYSRAEILISEGRTDEADEYLQDIRQTLDADEVQDYTVDVANIFSEYGLPEKAMEWLMRAKPETNLQFKELMGRTFFGLGRFEDCERIFHELVDKEPFSIKFWNGLASTQFMNGKYNEAIESCEYAIAIDPQDLNAIIAKANSLHRLDNFEEALHYYKRYIEIEPNDIFALLYAGTCLNNLRRTEEAVRMLEKSMSVADSDSPFLNDICQELAFAYSDSGLPDKALEILQKTDDLDCDHAQIDVIKGHIMLNHGDFSRAEEFFRHAMSITSYPKDTLLRVIISFYDNHYLNDAHRLFQRYFALTDPLSDDGEGYAYMALCCYKMKRYDEYLTYLEKASQTNPQTCRKVLGHLFPDELNPEDYYNYIKDKLDE